jgi:hypothetical protein
LTIVAQSGNIIKEGILHENQEKHFNRQRPDAAGHRDGQRRRPKRIQYDRIPYQESDRKQSLGATLLTLPFLHLFPKL